MTRHDAEIQYRKLIEAAEISTRHGLHGAALALGAKARQIYDTHLRVGRAPRSKRCDDCGKEWADYPSNLCPGCEAYREHTGAA